MTPLYKKLKTNGTSFYAFPSAAEDISAAYQNSNYKMYFSKYVLLNLPKQNLNSGSGTASKPIYFDFDNTFRKSVNAFPAATYKEQIIESLRNYVANQEIVIKESRLNNTDYYYDNNALETTTEKIFFKWAKKLNIIDFEPAIPDDEYFSNLAEFQSASLNDDQYFPEYLWKERDIVDWNLYSIMSDGNYLQIEFNVTTNFVVGDVINIHGLSVIIAEIDGSQTSTGVNVKVTRITAPSGTTGQLVTLEIPYTGDNVPNISGQVKLVYNRLVQYIGEIQGVSNVQEANRSYTEVHAHIPDHTGRTPDILFRTMLDVNYKPNQTFPIIPSQYQPEIIGAESFSSPIVNTPQNYPGSYFGQFDTLDFTYETANGDSVRRSGSYYGVAGDINNPVINGKAIDGISMDFNTSHYVKMNILNRNLTNFDQFNALEINNIPPTAFEFNAILWYYNVEDNAGNVRTNLYGISFLDNPDNNVITEETGLRFPTYKKFVTNGIQDGTSFAFSLNLNFNIINENPQDSYNPEAINSVFSMNLFNTSMSRLAATNDSFINLIVLSISVNLGFLGFFKYYNFFITSFSDAVTNLGIHVDVWTLKVILPVGISFYTFHGLSYVIDIYYDRIKPEKNFIDYSVFVSFFPLLVAGPIERATHLLPQIQRERKFNYQESVDGLRQILWGLFKKIVIADNCAQYANMIFNDSAHQSGSNLVLGAFFFTFQIYCDFSGYSDIALGVARLFGVDLLRNFAFPYFSRDIAEFWRRWHISLSTWFRDYLYIPLGGSKGGTWMKVRNTFIIFLVSGFWHGSNWTFVFWGFLNALYFLPVLLAKKNRNNMEIVALGKLVPSAKEFLSILITFMLTMLAWIFFRAKSMTHAFSYISGIFTKSLFSKPTILPLSILVLVLLFVLVEWFGRSSKYALEELGLKWNRTFRWSFYYAIVLLIIFFMGKEQEFIYFQF